MSKAEKRGFFRGAEFSRLLILAAMVAIGWPLVVHYGFTAKPTEKPKLPCLPRESNRAYALAAATDHSRLRQGNLFPSSFRHLGWATITSIP